MIRKVQNWTVDRLYRDRGQFSFPEYQREKQLWSDERKGMLIDSILQDIDIPKLYFNRADGLSIEVVDGQQRLWSIWDFLDGKYSYKPGKHHFADLSDDERKRIENYAFQATVFEDAKEEYLRLLFLRLQLGLLLNTGERLNASHGKMKQLVFERLAKHEFVDALGIPKRRFAKQTLCAQITINSFRKARLGKFARTRAEDLLHFFEEFAAPLGKDAEFFKLQSTRIQRIVDEMRTIFGERARELKNRSYILSLYLFVDDLVGQLNSLPPQRRKTVASFSFALWKKLKDENRLGIDRTNKEMYLFQGMLSSAPGEEYQITARHEKLSEYFQHFERKGTIPG